MADKAMTIAGPAGRLQALMASPSGQPRGAAVICHPHPQYGGTMDNKVVHTLSRAFVLAGLSALRFNFRGVGGSEGEYDQGRGEVADVLAACALMREQCPRQPLWLAGFSFGAAMALRACDAAPATGLVTVAPPVDGLAAFAPPAGVPWLLVQGEADEVVDPQAVLAWAQARQPRPEVLRLPDVGHFFHGQLPVLREAVLEFVQHNGV